MNTVSVWDYSKAFAFHSVTKILRREVLKEKRSSTSRQLAQFCERVTVLQNEVYVSKIAKL